jgi:hypothetical protein
VRIGEGSVGGRRGLRVVAALWATASAPGCAGTAASPFVDRPDRTGIEIVVENRAWADLSVYASAGSGRQRLGSVAAGRSESFELRSLPSRVVDLEHFANPLASNSVYRTGRLMVEQGQRVTWTVHESASTGSVTIR